MDDSYQGEESPSSVFTTSTPQDKFSISLAFCLKSWFFNAFFSFAKRTRLDFDGFDEKEMVKLLADAPACPTTAVGQLSRAGDAWVRLLSLWT